MMILLGMILFLAQAQQGSVAGIVSKPGGTEPLQGAIVVLNPIAASSVTLPRPTRSEEDGRFSITGIEPGQYRLQVQSAQYGVVEYGQRKPGGPGTVLAIAAGQRMTDLKIPMLPTGTISGRITGRSGEPLAYATVQALRYLYQNGKRILAVAQTTTTDDRGEYRLFWLNSGKYVVVAGQRTSPSRPVMSSPLRPGETLRTLSLPLGMLATPGGQADALLEGSNLTRRILEDGTVQEESWMPTYYPGTTNRTQATAVDVAAGATTAGIDIVLGPSPVQKVHGRVVGIVAGQQVMVTLASGTQGMMGTALNQTPSLDGSFEFAGVLPGTYILAAQSSGGLLSTPVAVSVEDRDVENLSIALEPAITLTVRYTFEGLPQGQATPTSPILGALRPDLVAAYGTTAGNVRAVNISLGAGNVVALSGAPGDYQFDVTGQTVLAAEGVVREGAKSFFVKSMRMGREDAMNGFRLSSSGSNVLDVVLTTQVGAVSGVAIGRAGDPAVNSTVVLIPATARKRSSLYQAVVTGNDGRFAFQGLAPGDYKLFAWDDIENGAWQNAEFLVPYESRGRLVSISENSKDEVQLNVIYNP
jgi:hypothetical protein